MSDLIPNSQKFDIIRQELLKADLMGLIKLGAPEDEYDSEVNEIMHVINDVYGPESLSGAIYLVFTRSYKDFNQCLRYTDCQPIGQSIWSRLYEIKLRPPKGQRTSPVDDPTSF